MSDHHVCRPFSSSFEFAFEQTVRTAGGQVWEDHSLADWSDDDFRVFCGDLGNDVNDELLTRTFNKYASFIKAKVIRDKRTGKSKGFGFISFKDPSDFSKALKEMDGKCAGWAASRKWEYGGIEGVWVRAESMFVVFL